MSAGIEAQQRRSEAGPSRRLRGRQWALCAVPLVLGLVVGVASPGLQYTGAPVCQMVQRLSARTLQDQPAGTQPSSTLLAEIIPDIDFDLLAREVPARLRPDIELGRRNTDRLLVIVDPAKGQLTAADAPIIEALARIATWIQEQCG